MEKIYASALRLLTRRDHSLHELSNKLLLRGFTPAEISTVLIQLQKENLLNETRYIACFIRSRVNKGFGPLKICAELGRHGIDQHRILSNEEWLNIDWHRCVQLVKKKRFGRSPAKTLKDQAQQMRYLRQRGFTQSQARMALGEI